MSSSPELEHKNQLNKECIFESIRLSEFPNRPSRRRCLFMIDVEEAIHHLEYIGFKGTYHQKLLSYSDTFSAGNFYHGDPNHVFGGLG